jgi:2-desacetyl-2-hydroxyethyl bacteriochlorophyllide A dehydrogenase
MPSPDLMTATRFYRQGEPLQIDQIPRPEPGPYDVLVNVEAVGICGSDIHITIEGTTPTPYQPITLGHEIAGTIERPGSAVSGWTAGDRIVVNALVTDGTCTQCLNGRSEVCLTRTAIGIHTDGGLADYVLVPARNLCRLPDNVSFPIGAITTDAVATPFHALRDVAHLTTGESLAVIGTGGLGLHAIQIGRLLGAYPIIAIDNRPEQSKRARILGADLTLNPQSERPVEAVLAATGGHGVDVAAEFVGTSDTIAWAVEMLRIGGRAVVAGLGPDPITVLPPMQFVRKQLQLLGSYGFTSHTINTVLQLVSVGRLDLSNSITHTYPLADINTALHTLHHKIDNPQRVVITNSQV